jgi:hypothetical protein
MPRRWQKSKHKRSLALRWLVNGSRPGIGSYKRMPNGERVEQELKPSEKALLKAGPTKPHDAEYHHPKFPNLYEIINRS